MTINMLVFINQDRTRVLYVGHAGMAQPGGASDS